MLLRYFSAVPHKITLLVIQIGYGPNFQTAGRHLLTRGAAESLSKPRPLLRFILDFVQTYLSFLNQSLR